MTVQLFTTTISAQERSFAFRKPRSARSFSRGGAVRLIGSASVVDGMKTRHPSVWGEASGESRWESCEWAGNRSEGRSDSQNRASRCNKNPSAKETRRNSKLDLWKVSSRCGSHPMLLETLPAVNRPALRGPERHRGFFPALGTDSRGLYPVVAARCRLIPFRLAGLATFRVILEMPVGKEKLFSCGEDKIFTAVHALQGSVIIFRIFRHRSEPPEIHRVSRRQ